MDYIEISLGSARHSGIAIHKDMLGDYLKKAQEANLELYRSVFSFDKGIMDHMRTNKSPSGYEGTKYLDIITLDIDRAKDTDAMVYHRTKVFGERLMDDWKLSEDLIHFYYSGSGYHICIPDIFQFKPSSDLPKTVKLTLDEAFPEADTVFYHNAGLIRVNNTINEKTGKYKVWLPYEIMYGSLNGVLEYASNIQENPPEFPDIPEEAYAAHIVKETPKPIPTTSFAHINASKNAPCFQAMYEVGEEEGTRHIRIIRLASHYRKQGIPIHATISAMQAYAPSLDRYEIEKQVKSCYENDYNWGCTDPELSKFCIPNCIYYKNKDYAPSLSSAHDLEKLYVKHARTDFSRVSFDFGDIYKLIDLDGKPISAKVYPDNFITVIGDTGLGKTAFMQNLAVKVAPMKVLYISTEFSLRLLYRRFVQVAHNKSAEEIDEYYAHSDNSLSDAIKHITFFGKMPTTVELETMVSKFTPQILLVDVIDDIAAPGMIPGSVSNDLEVVKTFKKIAEQHQIITIGVHHIRKSSAEDEEGNPRALTVHSGKGSGAYSQKPDMVISVEGTRDGHARTVRTLKSRDSSPFKILFDFDRTNFRFNQMRI